MLIFFGTLNIYDSKLLINNGDFFVNTSFIELISSHNIDSNDAHKRMPIISITSPLSSIASKVIISGEDKKKINVTDIKVIATSNQLNSSNWKGKIEFKNGMKNQIFVSCSKYDNNDVQNENIKVGIFVLIIRVVAGIVIIVVIYASKSKKKKNMIIISDEEIEPITFGLKL